MRFVRKSPMTGKMNVRDIEVDPAAFQRYVDGALIQDALKDVSPADREFIMTGITPEEWDATFSTEDDDGDL